MGVPDPDTAQKTLCPRREGFIDAQGDADGPAFVHDPGRLDTCQADDRQGLSSQAVVRLDSKGSHRKQEEDGQPMGFGELQDIQQWSRLTLRLLVGPGSYFDLPLRVPSGQAHHEPEGWPLGVSKLYQACDSWIAAEAAMTVGVCPPHPRPLPPGERGNFVPLRGTPPPPLMGGD